MKKLLCGILLLGSINAFAEWKESYVYLDSPTVTDPEKIVRVLDWSKSIQHQLLLIEFTSPSKLVVKSASGRVISLKWENDEDCQVADPTKIEERRFEDFSATYYFVDRPNKIKNLGITSAILRSPCN